MCRQAFYVSELDNQVYDTILAANKRSGQKALERYVIHCNVLEFEKFIVNTSKINFVFCSEINRVTTETNRVTHAHRQEESERKYC